MHRRFEQTVQVAAPLALVLEHLAAVRHDIPAHDPYAVATKRLRHNVDRGRIVEDFLVRDRFGRGPMSLSIRYHTRITLDEADATVMFETKLPLGIRLVTLQSCEPDESHTRVHESVDVTAPLMLLWTVYHGVARAQKQLLARVKASAESVPADCAEAFGQGPDN